MTLFSRGAPPSQSSKECSTYLMSFAANWS